MVDGSVSQGLTIEPSFEGADEFGLRLVAVLSFGSSQKVGHGVPIDRIVTAQQGEAKDDIAQFANIARPRVIFERGYGSIADIPIRQSVLRCLGQEVPRKCADVGFSLP